MPTDAIVARLREQVETMWPQIAGLADAPVEELLAQRDRILARTSAMKRYLQRFEPIRKLREEQIAHAVVSGLPQPAAVEARIRLADLPWVAVVPGTQRTYFDAEPVCHLLGRMGHITAENIDEHPPAIDGDVLRGYGPSDRVGITGVEYVAESWLRGRRGMVRHKRDGTVDLRIEPLDGLDARLTLDAELQRHVWQALAEAVQGNAAATGGAAVVLDVNTRQVLALVSYPTFNPADFDRLYPQLRRDVRTLPLLFRAVSAEYPPGSPFKLVAAMAGMADGFVDPRQEIFCQGYLHNPESFRCWIFRRPGPKQHGPLDLVGGIKNSCNVYFFTIGERLGVDRLCQWYDMLGIGGPMVTGLPEERTGLNPTPQWIQQHRHRRVQVADARFFAIGQGLALVTPLQQANVIASIAAGEYVSPQVLVAGGPAQVRRRLPISPGDLDLIRQGMWKVVNEPGGTAYRTGHFTESPYRETIELFGKTGSAQASRRVTAWRYRIVSQGHEPITLIAPDNDAFRGELREVIDELPDDIVFMSPTGDLNELAAAQANHPGAMLVERSPAAYWPPLVENEDDKDRPTHAWFAGFVQRKQAGQLHTGPRVAIALIVEFGGGGSAVAVPVGKRIAKLIHDSTHDYLGLNGPGALAGSNR
jgi:penicillin-binding protein 2